MSEIERISIEDFTRESGYRGAASPVRRAILALQPNEAIAIAHPCTGIGKGCKLQSLASYIRKLRPDVLLVTAHLSGQRFGVACLAKEEAT
jgi:hypothetical protein